MDDNAETLMTDLEAPERSATAKPTRRRWRRAVVTAGMVATLGFAGAACGSAAAKTNSGSGSGQAPTTTTHSSGGGSGY